MLFILRAVVSAANSSPRKRKYLICDRVAVVPKTGRFFRQMFRLDSTVSFLQPTTAAMRPNGTITVSVEFEVRGELQGLYFLKHCREQAIGLGISGWVKRDRRGAIIGVIQGPRSRIEQMICWLSCRGSPGSRIDECCLDNYRYISRPEYRSFSVRY